MEKVLNLNFIALMFLGFYSCYSGNDSPEKVAECYLKVYLIEDYDACMHYVTNESKEVLSQLILFSDFDEILDRKKREVEIKNSKCSEKGRNATYTCDAFVRIGDSETEKSMTVPMEKENGIWKVNIKRK